MIVRTRKQVEATDLYVHWGNGTSHRLLAAKDGMGFAMCHTIVHPGTSTRLKYDNHLEACYCIEGTGWLRETDGTEHRIEPGVMYALDRNDDHTLSADDQGNLVLVSVFNPPLTGKETHAPDGQGPSGY